MIPKIVQLCYDPKEYLRFLHNSAEKKNMKNHKIPKFKKLGPQKMVRAYVCMKLSKCPHIPLGHDLFFIPFYMLSTFFQNLSKILRNTVKGPSLMMVILIPRQNHKIFFSQDLVKQYYLFSGANVIDNVLFYTENMSC